MNKATINFIVFSCFLVSLAILLLMKPPEVESRLEARLHRVYLDGNEYVLDVEVCSYDKIYLEPDKASNSTISQLFTLKNKKPEFIYSVLSGKKYLRGIIKN
ncbi:MAG TPA: hypothetical protein ENN46_04105 [Candidatus Woesearchaeota archaeon]|nr:hypothetical protein [Candidatus Woesearchaeota archaeon]